MWSTPFFDLFPDRLYEPVWTVALPGVAGSEEVPSRGGQEVAAGEHVRPGRSSRRLEGPLPGHVHEVASTAAPHRGHAGLGHAGHQVLAEGSGQLGHRRAGRIGVLRVDVDVPQSGHQVSACQVDDPVMFSTPSGLGILAGAHGRYSPVIHRYCGSGSYTFGHAVDEVAVY